MKNIFLDYVSRNEHRALELFQAEVSEMSHKNDIMKIKCDKNNSISIQAIYVDDYLAYIDLNFSILQAIRVWHNFEFNNNTMVYKRHIQNTNHVKLASAVQDSILPLKI